MDLAEFDHPSFVTAAATAGSYLLILTAMTVALFGIPYLVFLAL
ncbi:hypothetical protein [Halomarina litorea]|nr:hypothetical protein [Halomarina sp. BCD28]